MADLTNTTWVLNDTYDVTTLPQYSYSSTVDINSSYSIDSICYEAGSDYEIIGTNFFAKQISRDDVYNVCVAPNGTLLFKGATVTFTGGTDVTNSSLISWVTTNMTQVIEEEETPSKPTEYTLRIDGVENLDYENVIINGVKYPTKKYVPEWTGVVVGKDYEGGLTIKITKETADETRIYHNDTLLLNTTTIGENTVTTPALVTGDKRRFEGAEFIGNSTSGIFSAGVLNTYDVFMIGKNFTKITDYLLKTIATNLYIPRHIQSIGKQSLITMGGTLIIPKNVKSIGSQAMKSPKNIVFEHTPEDNITLPTAGSSTGMLYDKSNRGMTIYHYGNETILNYDYSKDNVTPTFVDLREEK